MMKSPRFQMLAAPLISMVFYAAAYAKPPAPAGRAATCAAIEKETQKLITDALKAGEFELSAKGFIEGIKPLGTCIEPVVGGGQWALVLKGAPEFSTEDVTPPDAYYDDEGEYREPPERVTATKASLRNWTPVFVKADGTRILLEGELMLPFYEAYLDASALSVPVPWRHEDRSVEAFARPHPEGGLSVVFQNAGDLATLIRYDGMQVIVDHAGNALPYPTSLRDIDKDGILDLVDSMSIVVPHEGAELRVFDLVALGRPDGSFDTHAPFVRETYRKQCSGVGNSPWVLGHPNGQRAGTNIFCGLLFGVPKATVKNALEREREQATDPEDNGVTDILSALDDLLRSIDSDLPRYVNRTDGFRALEVISASAISAMKSFGVYDFGAAQAVDGDRGTSWQPLKAKDAWLELKLRGPEPVAALEFANGFQRFDKLGDLFEMNSRPTKVTVALGGKTFDLTLDPASRELQRLDLPEVVTTDTIRITVKSWKKGSRWDHVAISEVVPLAR